MDTGELLTMAQEDKTSRQSQLGDVIKRRQSFKRPRDDDDDDGTQIAFKLMSARRRHRKEALPSVTESTLSVSKIVAGNQTAPNVKVTVVDCRYPYEYEGGHIKGAVNLYDRPQVRRLLEHRRPSTETTEILVFHCEFSCQRGPALCRYLRSEDRAMNAENYPRLTFPEVYVMEGGYKHFYTNYKELCDPARYTPMLHQDHRSELRHFRGKSKSRTLEEKKRNFTKTPKAIRF